MKSKFATLAALIALAVAPLCAQQVTVVANPAVPFSQFHTYAWGTRNENHIRNTILAQIAMQAVNQQLQSRGYVMVTEDQPHDLLVTANAGLRRRTTWTTWSSGGWGGRYSTTTPDTQTEATLVVDVYNTSVHELCWRGVARNTLNSNSSKTQKMVNKAINKMFQQWPKS
jgi:hypothetical protein